MFQTIGSHVLLQLSLLSLEGGCGGGVGEDVACVCKVGGVSIVFRMVELVVIGASYFGICCLGIVGRGSLMRESYAQSVLPSPAASQVLSSGCLLLVDARALGL